MSKFLKVSAIAAGVLGLAVMAAPASASAVFDDFTAVQSATDQITNATGVFGAQVSGAGIFGTYREVYAFKGGNSTSDVIPLGVRTSVFGGRARFSSDDDSYGYGLIRWDGIATNGNITCLSLGCGPTAYGASLGLNENLYNFGSGLTFNYNSDNAFNVDILIYTATQVFNASQSVLNTGGLDVVDSVTWGEFTNVIGNVAATATEFTNVRAVEVLINGQLLNIERLDMNFTAPRGIPEPGSMALVGLALLGLGAASRRKA